MDQQTQQILENYSKLFQLTFSAQNDAERKKAEEEISQQSKNDPKFLEYILHLLVLEQTPSPIKQSASYYIQTYVRNFVISEQFQTEAQKTTVNFLFEGIIEPKINITHKQPIVSALSMILQFDQDNSIKTIMFDKIVSLLRDNVKEKFIGCYLALQPILTSTRQPKHLDKLAQGLIEIFCDSILTLLEPLNTKLVELGQQNQAPQEALLVEFKQCLQVAQSWCQTMKAFIDKFTENESSQLKVLMKGVIFHNKIALVFMKIIQINFPNQSQIKECIISTTEIQELDQEVNELKVQILKSYSKINTFMFENRGRIDIKPSIFFQMLSQILPFIMSSVYNFCFSTQQNLFTVLENEKMSALIVQCLIFLKVCGNQQEFYPIFSQNKKQLTLNVLLPLMRTSSEELDTFEDSPEEFVHLALDTCDKQFSETYKTAASQVLEILCDNIDGATTMIGLLCLTTIQYSMQKVYNPDQQEDFSNNQNYPALQDCMDSIFIKHTTAEIRIDTCLMALSVMSYVVPKRPDIIREIENLFKQHQQYFFTQNLNSKLIKARICLFIGYYSDTIYQKSEDAQIQQQIIEFLIQCTQSSHPQAITLQAIDSLINIYDEEDLSQKLSTYIIPVFSHLIKQIESTQANQFLDLIQTIIKAFVSTLKDNLQLILECVQYLVKRIESEYKLLQSQERTSTLFINKCWNIIRQIADTGSYIETIQDQIEQALSPLFVALAQPEKIDFDDDILLTITSFLQKRKNITPATAQLLPYFPNVFQKYDNSFGHMFQTLNYVIQYGQQYFESQSQESKNTLVMIVQLSITSMHSTGARVNEADNAEGATLLQLLIFKYHHLLTDELWTTIFQQTAQKINSKITFNFLKARVYGIICQGFIRNFAKTQEILSTQMGALDQILNFMLQDASVYKTNFDIKIFVLSFSNLLTINDLKPEIIPKLSTILDILVTLLKNQENNENKKKNDYQESDSEEDELYGSDDEDDDDMKYGDEQEQDKITLKFMVSDIKNEDEFNTFKRVILQLKEKNQEQLFQFVSTLQESKQNFLKQVLNVQRIQIGDRFAIRKIVRRKKQQ